MSNQAISQEIRLGKGRVKMHVSNMLGKLDAASRTEAAPVALKQGLISLERK